MTAQVSPQRQRHPGLVERLIGSVRSEFRSTLLVFSADDPIFGGGACRIQGCQRPARGRGMCPAHRQRWVTQGHPDLDTFVATTDPGWQRQRPNQRCAVPGCGYGSCRAGMCVVHGQQWRRAGQPDVERWRAAQSPPTPPAGKETCRIEHCQLWPHAALPFCHAHAQTWRANGRPDTEEFATRFSQCVVTEDESVRFERLGPQLTLEIQYGLQCRRDERRSKTFTTVVMQVIRFLAGTDAVSLLDHTEDEWRLLVGRPAPKDNNSRAFLIYCRRKVEDLVDAGGWDAEYPRDTWRLRRLGFPGNQTLTFDAIPQSWLRSLAKRWLRWRLGTGLGLEASRRGLRALTRFARFCDRINVTALAGVQRVVLEHYLADLHTEMSGSQREGDHIGQLNSLFQAVRQHGWDDTLPATAVLFPDDHPQRPDRPPRALSEQVMAQVEQPSNLDRWDNPAHRLVTMILIGCGLRVTDALSLGYDCVVADAEGAPYLRYYNHKMKRQALVPIGQELHQEIADQQAVVTAAGAALLLFPRPTKNPDQNAPISSNTYRAALSRWLQQCNVRDEHGRAVHLTPHQWRHTLGTRLINRDVPQEVVRRILDHDSPQMTAHYARLHDTTVRRHWEAARKVDITGRSVVVDPDGPLAEAAWAKQRLGRATQALPNGFCGLPVQKSCPHANACLTCPMFLTTSEFLPQHNGQRQQVLQLITAAEANGHTRIVEMNRQVLENLDRIITALKDDDTSERASDAG